LCRLVSSFAVLVAAGSPLAGCGGSGADPPVATTSAAATASTPSASRPLTKTRATEYARGVNLRAADLPAMRASSPGGEGKAPTRSDAELARCDGGVSAAVRVIDRSSPTFASSVGGENEHIHSDVEVMPTQALAERHNAAQTSRRGLECLARFIPTALAKRNTAHLHYGPIEISRLPNPLPGVHGSFAIEVTTTILGVPAQVAATPPRVFIDALGFLSGASEIALTAVGFPEPVGIEGEQRLVSLLYSRAGEHKL